MRHAFLQLLHFNSRYLAVDVVSLNQPLIKLFMISLQLARVVWQALANFFGYFPVYFKGLAFCALKHQSVYPF